MQLAAITPICEEDACWIDQYLAEIERLGVKFAMHFDRCSQTTKNRLQRHPAYLGCSSQDNPNVEHEENRRQGPYDIICALGGFDGFLIWDMDETWERTAPEKFESFFSQTEWDEGRIEWLNLWGDKDHIRVDNPSNPQRVKIVNLQQGRRWEWRGQIVHPYTIPTRQSTVAHSNIRCIHWGLMTREMRVNHKKRWDRIFTKVIGRNPYGFWDYILDEEKHPPVIETHDLL